MKILAVNGSGRLNGNSKAIIDLCRQQLGEDIEFVSVDLAKMTFSGCVGCEGCSKTYACVLKDDMQNLYPLLEEADGLILVSPTYFYNITSKMKAFIERLYPYELFDPQDRHVWLSYTEVFGLKYALVIGVCEQADEKDMGFTIPAMTMPLEALGYRVVDKIKVLYAFKKHDLMDQNIFVEEIQEGVRKLAKTIALKDSVLKKKKLGKLCCMSTENALKSSGSYSFP